MPPNNTHHTVSQNLHSDFARPQSFNVVQNATHTSVFTSSAASHGPAPGLLLLVLVLIAVRFIAAAQPGPPVRNTSSRSPKLFATPATASTASPTTSKSENMPPNNTHHAISQNLHTDLARPQAFNVIQNAAHTSVFTSSPASHGPSPGVLLLVLVLVAFRIISAAQPAPRLQDTRARSPRLFDTPTAASTASSTTQSETMPPNSTHHAISQNLHADFARPQAFNVVQNATRTSVFASSAASHGSSPGVLLLTLILFAVRISASTAQPGPRLQNTRTRPPTLFASPSTASSTSPATARSENMPGNNNRHAIPQNLHSDVARPQFFNVIPNPTHTSPFTSAASPHGPAPGLLRLALVLVAIRVISLLLRN